MSRSGYSEDCDNDWSLIRWRGAVKSAIRGKRGQALLKEMLEALDAMPVKRLIRGELVATGLPECIYRPEPREDVIVGGDQLVNGRGEVFSIGEVCAFGALGMKRGVDMSTLDAHDSESVAGAFNVADALAKEIAWINDDDGWHNETPEKRFERVRAWVEGQIIKESAK